VFHPLALVRARRYKEAITDPENPVSWGLLKPEGARLWHFDGSLTGTQGETPLSGAVATLRPGEGRFGGAVAVEEGTTNIVPSNRLKFEGWTAYSGAQVTRTQNVEFPEIGRNDATRIRSTGGTGRLKYYVSIETSIAGQAYTGSVYIKNIGSKPVQFSTQFGPSVTVNPGERTRAIVSGIGDGTSGFQLRFEALNVDDDLDFIAWGPQAERKPFATSFVDGTRPDGILAYPIALKDTIACYRKSHTDEDYKHVVKRSDGTVFVDGVEDSEYDVGWIAGRNLVPNNLDFWEIGSVVESSAVGSSYDVVKYHSTTRIRTKELILVDDIYTVSFNAELFDVFFVYFDEDKKYLGTYRGWSSGGYTHSTAVKYVAITLRYKTDDSISIDAIKQSRIKLEKGSTATDWTPAPEDLGYDGDTLMLSNQTGLIDELLILPFAATPEQIQAWYAMGAPFYDADRLAKRYLRRMEMLGWYIPPNPTP
jgi:hypothetical protein